MSNFLSIDPSYSGTGLNRGGHLEKEIWTEFIDKRDILRKVAEAYNQSVDTGEEMTLGAVRGHLTAITRVELKTVYEANYYPTVQLRATADSPEQAHALATAWAHASAEFLESIRRSAQRNTLQTFNEAYSRARTSLKKAESAGSPASIDVKLEQAFVLALGEKRLNAELALADLTREFEIVSMPELPEFPISRRSGPVLFAVFAGVATIVLVASVCGTVLVDVARSVNGNEA